MTDHTSEGTLEAFFDRLLDQQTLLTSAQEVSLRQGQIFCGRWLALRRLGLGITLDALAEQCQLAPETILFVETGLANAELAGEASWKRYCTSLSAAHDDSLVWRIVRTALGHERPPDVQVMVRVMTDLNTAYAGHQ